MMIVLMSLLTLLSLIAFTVFIIGSIVQLIRRKSATKPFIVAGASLGLSIVLFLVLIVLASNSSPKSYDIVTEKNKATKETSTIDKEKTNNTTTESKAESDEKETSESEKVSKNDEKPALTVLSERDKSEFPNLDNSQLEGMKRKPEDHYGELVKFSGKVIQVSPGENDYIQYYRVVIDDNYDNVVLVKVLMPNLIESGRILEKDYVTLYSQYDGLNTYESTSGKSVTLPYFTTIGKTIELLDN